MEDEKKKGRGKKKKRKKTSRIRDEKNGAGWKDQIAGRTSIILLGSCLQFTKEYFFIGNSAREKEVEEPRKKEKTSGFFDHVRLENGTVLFFAWFSTRKTFFSSPSLY